MKWQPQKPNIKLIFILPKKIPILNQILTFSVLKMPINTKKILRNLGQKYQILIWFWYLFSWHTYQIFGYRLTSLVSTVGTDEQGHDPVHHRPTPRHMSTSDLSTRTDSQLTHLSTPPDIEPTHLCRSGSAGRDQCTVSQADEGAVRIPKDRPSYFDISKVPIDGQMSNAFNDNICFI